MEGAPKKKSGPDYFVFPEYDYDRPEVEENAQRRTSTSRDCHSDDDVARGQGIPDYYDDRPLWRRQQKPPGQLSLQMVAIRRRERRERWLRKRQRNKTDLLSTGSSDTGSESSLRFEHPRLQDPTSVIDYSYYEQSGPSASTEPRQAMGSGILSSPKYSKPIMPFLTGGAQRDDDRSAGAESPKEVHEEKIRAKIASERLEASLPVGMEADGASSKEKPPWKVRHRDSFDQELSSDESFERSHGVAVQLKDVREGFRSDPNLAIPGIEETFNELESVKHILEELQDRSHGSLGVTKEPGEKCMPLTKENVRSIHEYYKVLEEASKSGRRSRMSIADRTESDLDIYSETQDDASSDSNMYADDEEDEDGADTYATADDDLASGTTGGSGSDTLGRRKPRRPRGDDDDNSYTNDDDYDDEISEDFVVSCTFYNSNAQPSATGSAGTGGGTTPVAEHPSSRSLVGSSGKSTPQIVTSGGQGRGGSQTSPVAGASVLHSDEEFWSGSAAIEASYRQLETAADAVSSTFQNAREQMIDIQQHLQALRRQMEGLEDEITPSTSVTMTPDMS